MNNKNTPIEFEFDIPIAIVLDIDPSRAPITKSGKAWSYFTDDNGIFWANRDLHSLLQNYKKGDKVEIVKKFAENKLFWEVNGEKGSADTEINVYPQSKPQISVPSGVPSNKNDIQEVLDNTRKILNILENGKNNKEETTEVGF